MQEPYNRHLIGHRHLLVVWGGLLVAPIAWILHQQASYLLVYHACPSRNTILFHIITAALLLIAAVGAYLAWKTWNDSGNGWADEGDSAADINRFLALVGLMMSGLFLLVILAQWIPTLLVDPCVR